MREKQTEKQRDGEEQETEEQGGGVERARGKPEGQRCELKRCDVVEL